MKIKWLQILSWRKKVNKLVFKLILQMKEVKYFSISLNEKKIKHILWYDLYLLLRHELQHQNTPTSVDCYYPGSWKALRKLNKGSKCCFVLHQNWSYCLLPFSLNVFLQCFLYYHLAAYCVHVASSQGMHYSSFQKMKMIQWVKFIYLH